MYTGTFSKSNGSGVYTFNATFSSWSNCTSFSSEIIYPFFFFLFIDCFTFWNLLRWKKIEFDVFSSRLRGWYKYTQFFLEIKHTFDYFIRQMCSIELCSITYTRVCIPFFCVDEKWDWKKKLLTNFICWMLPRRSNKRY